MTRCVSLFPLFFLNFFFFEAAIYGNKHIYGHFLKQTKGKVFPYSLPSVGPGADPGVQAVSPQVT